MYCIKALFIADHQINIAQYLCDNFFKFICFDFIHYLLFNVEGAPTHEFYL